MNTFRQGLWKHTLRIGLIGGLLTGAVGCAGLDSGQSAVGTAQPRTAEEHLVAANLYDREARSEAAATARYERRADALNTYMDPKGFRRAGLATAAQEHRRKAR